MKIWFKRLILLAALVGGGYLLWQQRDRIALIQNNALRIQGTWYRYEMNRKGLDPYVFTERIIEWDGVEWGSYELRSNDEIEVMVGSELDTYRLDFPNEDHMVWWGEVEGKEVRVVEWER